MSRRMERLDTKAAIRAMLDLRHYPQSTNEWHLRNALNPRGSIPCKAFLDLKMASHTSLNRMACILRSLSSRRRTWISCNELIEAADVKRDARFNCHAIHWTMGHYLLCQGTKSTQIKKNWMELKFFICLICCDSSQLHIYLEARHFGFGSEDLRIWVACVNLDCSFSPVSLCSLSHSLLLATNSSPLTRLLLSLQRSSSLPVTSAEQPRATWNLFLTVWCSLLCLEHHNSWGHSLVIWQKGPCWSLKLRDGHCFLIPSSSLRPDGTMRIWSQYGSKNPTATAPSMLPDPFYFSGMLLRK